jgi:hypothetical protein
MDKALKKISHGLKHECAQTDFKGIPDITGNDGMDAIIIRSKNKDMLAKLSLYVADDLYDPMKMDK